MEVDQEKREVETRGAERCDRKVGSSSYLGVLVLPSFPLTFVLGISLLNGICGQVVAAAAGDDEGVFCDAGFVGAGPPGYVVHAGDQLFGSIVSFAVATVQLRNLNAYLVSQPSSRGWKLRKEEDWRPCCEHIVDAQGEWDKVEEAHG